MNPIIGNLNWQSMFPRSLGEWTRPPSDLTELTDMWVVATVVIGLFFLVWALWRTVQVWFRTGKYLRLATRLRIPQELVQKRSEWSRRKGLPLAADFNELLVEVPRLGAPLERDLKRCGSASEIFHAGNLGQGIVGSRLLMAAPAILTGLGVLGTFVGLAMGIGGLDLDSQNIENLDKSISPLIKGSSTAFVTSVWGVACSLVFTLIEKNLEWFAIWRIRKVETAFNSLAPRYTPEESMIGLHRSASEQESILKGLAVAIGEEMQKAINRIGEGITTAVQDALGGQAEGLGEKSAELMSGVISKELENLRQAVSGMSDGFKEDFGAANERLTTTIGSFGNVLSGIDSTVKASQESMNQAVGRLTAHEEVVKGLDEAAIRLKEAAVELVSMRDTFTLSAEKNSEAASAQEKAASKNELVAGKLETIGEKLPGVQEAIASGAQVIASLGQPLVDLKEILKTTPELFGQQAEEQSARDQQRSGVLLEQTENLAKTVAEAAEKFAQIETLSTNLSASAESLKNASTTLGTLAENISSASQKHADAARAAEKAAAAGERTAEKLEPIPQSLTELTGTLDTASGKIKEGADAARAVYRELVVHQKQWFEGIEIGLEAMRDRVQKIIDQYGDSVEGATQKLMDKWTEEVNDSLSKFSVQVQILEEALQDLTNEMNN
jgi:methyl-accepting chemotaxis protein